jgi:WD40 repeat protein/uncharacterized caspase-like protein
MQRTKSILAVQWKTAVFFLFIFLASSLFAQQPKLVLPVGHTSIVGTVVYSPDGKYILTGSWDNTAKVWETVDGKLLYVLKGHTGSVTSAVFSPDGKYIVTSSKDNTAKIWDAINGALLHDLKEHSDWVSNASFSPDGKYIVSSSWDSTAKIWDASNGKWLFDLKGHAGPVSSASFSPDGKYIVSSSWDSTAKIWNASNGKLMFELKGHIGAVTSASFSADGKYIATSSSDSTAKIWNASNGKLVFDLKGHIGYVTSASFSADGKYIATSSSDSTAKIWDVANGKLVYDLKGHTGSIKSVVYDRDNKYVLTASADNTARIWDASNGQLLQELKGHSNWINAAVFSPDGKYAATASSDNTAKTWKVADGHLLHNLSGHVAMANSAVLSPDGRYIVTVSSDSSVKIWDNADGHLIKNISHDANWMCQPVFSRDGKYFLTASFDNNLDIWSLPDGRLIRKLNGHTDWISSATFSDDGKYIVSASWDSTAKIWSVVSGNLLHNLHAHTNVVHSASFSKNGKYIVTSSWDHTAKIWSVPDGRLLYNLKGHGNEVRSAIFSNDGKYIVTSSWDSTAKIWSVSDGRLLHTLKGHNGFVNAAMFSPDGKYIATASMDSTAKIWNAQNGELLYNLKAHTRPVLAVSFSRDGKKMYTSSWDNTVKIWSTTDGHLLHSLESHTAPLVSMSVSTDERNIVTASEDNMLKKWDAQTGQLLYSFFAVDSTDYLITDKDGRYDGTESARKMLYYVCNNEAIDLEQFKDLAWEPHLAAKLNGINKEPVTAKKIAAIDLCNYTPIIEEKGISDSAYIFQIRARRGGISEAQLFVNNKLIKKYDPASLQKKDGSYVLSVNKKQAEDYFVSNGDNIVFVKAITENGVMQSRGPAYTSTVENKLRANPNMYLISIGISGYKGKLLKLDYASKDATDFSSAIIASAKKLLNIDGKQHVFAYTFDTETSDSRWPLKNEIAKAIDSIAQKAKPDDILVTFFAGHGLLKPGRKNFYMLTAEASTFEIDGVEKEVAISTEDLNEWSRKIKANKQILILDACSSGQVINDLPQLMTRGDLPADEQRALENLKDRTGLFILSASAPNQTAHESGSYNQGLLTYGLLSGIKLGGGLKDNKFIDVSRWFNFASDQVKILAKDIGVRQDPQILGSASFDVGIVDKEITDNIKLTVKKNIFRRSKFIEDENLLNDDIDLSAMVDKELNNLSEKGRESPLVFVPDNSFADAYSVRGKYAVAGNIISAKVTLVKGEKQKIFQFDTNGELNKKEELAIKILERLKRYLLFGN